MVLSMYKVYPKIILACLLLVMTGTVYSQRVTQTINDGWKFSLFEEMPLLLTLIFPVGLTFPFLIRGMQKMQMMKFPVISGEKAGTGKWWLWRN